MAEDRWYIASMVGGVPSVYHYVGAEGRLRQSSSWSGLVSGYSTKRKADAAIHYCVAIYGKYAATLEAIHHNDVRLHEITKRIRGER